jgi:hypothetical protein
MADEEYCIITIKFPLSEYDPDFDESITHFSHAVTELTFEWLDSWERTGMVELNFSNPDSERITETPTPQNDFLACEADSESIENQFCGLVEASCVCAEPKGHAGPHVCQSDTCRGSWVVRFPG